jgi:hypothetical protein
MSVPARAANPTGVVEGIDNNGLLTGYTMDPDAPSTAIQIDLYVDGPYGQGGLFLVTVPASYPRQDVGAHGFRVPLPPRSWDGQPHTYYVYGIDTDGTGQHNTLLSGSGVSKTLASTRVFISNGTLSVAIELRCGGDGARLASGSRT